MDAIEILFDLKQRVTILERDNPRRTRPVKPVDPGTAALLAMHRSVQSVEDRDVQAITTWLKNPIKKNAPSASGNSAEGNTARKAMH